MKSILSKLFEMQRLSMEEAVSLMLSLTNGKANDSQISSILTVYNMRPPTLEEIQGFRIALLDLAIKVDINTGYAIDLCGTGGDGKNTFNISTTAAFIVAGAGIPVVKHGNYGVSSVTGSSNLMEVLGYKFSSNADKLKNEIDKANICFMHAPLFHPALKAVAPVRRQLGVKTFFNILGPLVNPANPKYQLIGTYSIEVGRLYAYLLKNQLIDYRIVHSLDGYDEVSLTGPIKVFTSKGDGCLAPESFGFEKVSHECLRGGQNPEDSADVFLSILNNKADSDKVNVTIANAALAISSFKNVSIEEGVVLAKESLESGSAMNSFKKLMSLQ